MELTTRYPPSQWLAVGPWRIDLVRGTVSAQDGTAALSPRAEALLLLLARYANVLVTREQILETVWAGRVVEDAAITHCVWQIRKSLGDGGKDVVQTRAKRGYVLKVADSDWLRDPIETSAAPLTADDRPAAADATFALAADLEPASQAHRSVDAEATAGEGATAHASEAPASAVVAPRASSRSRTWRRLALGISAAAIAGLCAFAAWRQARVAPTFVLRPDIEASIAVSAPPSHEWVRAETLRDAVEYLYSRDVAAVVFQTPQTRNPFAGPHLQVRVTGATDARIEAELSIAQGEAILRERFVGPPHRLAPAMRALMVRALGPAGRASTPENDAVVAGRLAEQRFDLQQALGEYRRAVARDPRSVDARLGMARIFFVQGRIDEAHRALDASAKQASSMPSRRCRIDAQRASMSSEPASAPVCERAQAIVNLQRLELRDALRHLERLSRVPMGAEQWLEQENATILALLRLQEWSRAEYEIARAEGVARAAGWERARIELAANRGTLYIHRGRLQDAMRTRREVARAMDAIGNTAAAIENRILAIRPMQIVPGAEVAKYREELRAIADRAREIGSVKGEIDALLSLARLDRDAPETWRSHLARVRSLIADAGLERRHTLDSYFVMNETIVQQHYRDALAGVARLEASGNRHPRARVWSLTLRMRALFALDSLDDAVAAVDAMEKEGLDVPGSVDFCHLSWLFVESGRSDRARAYLERCRAQHYDRVAQAIRADFGLIAEARLHQRYGEPERAWPVLRPRIDALLALAEPSREEAESLALLARHASALPGADPVRLERALSLASAMAGRDGAGSRLRTGAHLLRWRLCARSVGRGCGPVLPPWAAEDHLEARLAREASAR